MGRALYLDAPSSGALDMTPSRCRAGTGTRGEKLVSRLSGFVVCERMSGLGAGEERTGSVSLPGIDCDWLLGCVRRMVFIEAIEVCVDLPRDSLPGRSHLHPRACSALLLTHCLDMQGSKNNDKKYLQ